MRVDIQGLERDPMLRGRVGRLVGAALETIKAAPVRARVTFFDDDGPKGGLALRCAVDLRVPYRPPIHIEHVAATPRLAFDGVMAALERQLERYRERARENRRHPKKYFVAKRLLMDGTNADPAPKRVRRRKVAS
ncbi:MAG TPA: HPF/RaiA family ribosome-associated protein [Verrucomicrobiae bacterium]|jgi:ribosome-associated translation inhibitor RaiA|nr:HPF/RaiA family ribosome-associated protein [Methylomirabilota bacterium]HWN92140.1 HPF/RaiA family ribosome-associated protein [Verrucomicrobiae bacterium]